MLVEEPEHMSKGLLYISLSLSPPFAPSFMPEGYMFQGKGYNRVKETFSVKKTLLQLGSSLGYGIIKASES